MDTPTEYPKPRRRGGEPPPSSSPPNAPALVEEVDETREDRVRQAAEMLVAGRRETAIVEALVEDYGVSPTQARRDLRDVRSYAQHVLGNEDAIATFVLQKLGKLEQVAERLHEDATEEAPDLVFDSESGLASAPSLDTRIKAKQQAAASARAYADVTKVQVGLVGARSRHYSPRAREASELETVSPDQQKALDAFWSDG